MEHKCKKTDIKTVEKCELNREQVIKALECCETGRAVSCEKCPMQNIEAADDVVCSEMLARYAISLIKELTEENERLRGVGIPDNAVYIRLSDAKTAILKYACEQTVSKYASSEICKAVRDGAEGAMNELDYLTPVSVAPIADTVKKMKERIIENACSINMVNSEGQVIKTDYQISADRLDQIAKEIIGGSYGKKD